MVRLLQEQLKSTQETTTPSPIQQDFVLDQIDPTATRTEDAPTAPYKKTTITAPTVTKQIRTDVCAYLTYAEYPIQGNMININVHLVDGPYPDATQIYLVAFNQSETQEIPVYFPSGQVTVTVQEFVSPQMNKIGIKDGCGDNFRENAADLFRL